MVQLRIEGFCCGCPSFLTRPSTIDRFAVVSPPMCHFTLSIANRNYRNTRLFFTVGDRPQGISNQADNAQRQEHLRPPRALRMDPDTNQFYLDTFSMEAAEAQASQVRQRRKKRTTRRKTNKT